MRFFAPLDLERAGDDAAHLPHPRPLLGHGVVAPVARGLGKLLADALNSAAG